MKESMIGFGAGEAGALTSRRLSGASLGIGEGLSGSIVVTALGAVVFLIPFLAYATNILHVFYVRGSSFYDAGWYAYLIHHLDLEIHDPPSVDNGMSFFNSHVSPLFILTSALGRLLPLTRIQFYAAYTGIADALPALAVFWLLVSGYRMRAPLRSLAAALLGLLFSFDGLALAIAKFPHFEMFLVGAGMMFLVALVLGRLVIALFFFLLCLLTREDAGFHLFALLALAFLLQWKRGAGKEELKPIAIFAAAAFFYSSAVVLLQHALSNNHFLLVNEYLGSPPFAHVTLSSMATRFWGWVAYRRYVILPALFALLWAILRRNPQVILGYAAFLPWALLHLAAARPMLGTLPSYYAFPFMFASLWPLIGILMERRRSRKGGSILEPACGFALLTAVSFTPSPYQQNPTHIDLPADFLSPPSFSRQEATDHALARLAADKELGKEVVDESVLALVPELYRAGNLLSWRSDRHPDTLITFAQGFESALARKTAARAGLHWFYAVPGTSIRIASKRAIKGFQWLEKRRSSK